MVWQASSSSANGSTFSHTLDKIDDVDVTTLEMVGDTLYHLRGDGSLGIWLVDAEGTSNTDRIVVTGATAYTEAIGFYKVCVSVPPGQPLPGLANVPPELAAILVRYFNARLVVSPIAFEKMLPPTVGAGSGVGKLGVKNTAPAGALANTSNALADGLTSSQSINSTDGLAWSSGTTTSYTAAIENTNTTSPSGLLIKSAAGSTSASGRSFLVVNGTTPALVVLNNNKVGIGTQSPAEALDVTGNLQLNTAGNKLIIATGTNAAAGSATLVNGTVTVSSTAVTANSIILITSQNNSGSVGSVKVTGKTPGTSFTITSYSWNLNVASVETGDTSTVGYVIFN